MTFDPDADAELTFRKLAVLRLITTIRETMQMLEVSSTNPSVEITTPSNVVRLDTHHPDPTTIIITVTMKEVPG